jgi:hypothetical protein
MREQVTSNDGVDSTSRHLLVEDCGGNGSFTSMHSTRNPEIAHSTSSFNYGADVLSLTRTAQLDSSPSTSNKRFVEKKEQEIKEPCHSTYIQEIDEHNERLYRGLKRFSESYPKEVENCCKLLNEISQYYIEKLTHLYNNGVDDKVSFYENSKSWILQCIEDVLKYSLFILPELFEFRQWFEKNYTFEKIYMDPDDKVGEDAPICKVTFVMALIEHLHVYIKVVAKMIGPGLKKMSGCSEDASASHRHIYFHEGALYRMRTHVASLLRHVGGDDLANAYSGAMFRSITKVGLGDLDILVFDTMIRLILIIDEEDLRPFNGKGVAIKNVSSLIRFVNDHFLQKGVDGKNGFERIMGYTKKYLGQGLLAEAAVTQNETYINNCLLEDITSVLEELKCLGQVLSMMNWKILTSDILVERPTEPIFLKKVEQPSLPQ